MTRTDVDSPLRRVTDLFDRGRIVELGEDSDGKPVLVWVTKLNPFERAEAQRDGQFGQAKRLMMLGDDSEEIALLIAQGVEGSDAELVEAILTPQAGEMLLLGRDDVHADPDWRDKLPVVERYSALVADGSTATEEEKSQAATWSGEYFQAVRAAQEERLTAKRAEYEGMDRAELLKLYADSYRDIRALDAFQEDYEVTELYYAIRHCEAVPDGEDWDHTKCRHLRLCQNRRDVRTLPDDVLSVVRRTLREIQMTPRETGNSHAPSTSSKSSEQPSAEAASTPSTQAVT